MFNLLLVDLLFGPLEGGGVLIPAGDKGFDRLDQHFDAGEAGSLQGSSIRRNRRCVVGMWALINTQERHQCRPPVNKRVEKGGFRPLRIPPEP